MEMTWIPPYMRAAVKAAADFDHAVAAIKAELNLTDREVSELRSKSIKRMHEGADSHFALTIERKRIMEDRERQRFQKLVHE